MTETPPDPPRKPTRDALVSARLQPAEYDRLKKAADTTHLSVSSLIRQLILVRLP